MRNIRYKVADVETAGFKGPDETSSGVVDVAWVEIDEHLNILGERSSLINPGRPIESGASEVHGLFDADVAFSPSLTSFYRNHWDDSPTVLICHNVPFDEKFLAPQIQLLVGKVCTLQAARQYLPEAPNHKLATLAEHYQLERGTAHRAAGDALTALSLLRLIVKVTGRTLPELVKLQSKPAVLTSMPFGMHKGKPFNDLPTSYLQWLVSTEGMPADIVTSANIALTLKA